MKKTTRNLLSLRLLLLFLIPFTFSIASFKPAGSAKKSAISAHKVGETKNTIDENINSKMFLYDSLQLDNLGLTKQGFMEGLKGYYILLSEGKLNNDNVISIADFTLPSSQKRLFIIDLANHKLLFNTYVAHGRSSGKEYANRFSNNPDSHMSSLGFYVTLQTYYGVHGLSLRLEGEEKGINDNAKSRAIVIHPADYVSENTVKSLGFLGRSFGCPALPAKLAGGIIQTIKDGSCFFVYSNRQKYISRSPLLQSAS